MNREIEIETDGLLIKADVDFDIDDLNSRFEINVHRLIVFSVIKWEYGGYTRFLPKTLLKSYQQTAKDYLDSLDNEELFELFELLI